MAARHPLSCLVVSTLIVAGVATAQKAEASAATTNPAVPRGLSGRVMIRGSDSILMLSQAVAKEFKGRAPSVDVEVLGGGTGSGIQRLQEGLEISMAARPIRKGELEALTNARVEFVEIPVAIDALALVVSQDNDWVDYLTVDELKQIFASTTSAATWKDIRSAWPAQPLDLLVRGRNTGTHRMFLSSLGRGVEMRSDVTECRTNDTLVAAVAGSRGGVGFVGCTHALASRQRIRTVMIDGGHGPVPPTVTAVSHGKYTPLSNNLLLYVRKDALDRPEVVAFVEFYLAFVSEAAIGFGYVPVSRSIQTIARRKLAERECGTHFLDEKGNRKSESLASLYK